MSKWLAVELGVDASEVSRWRWGLHVPEPATRDRIAALLGLPVADLFEPSAAADLDAAA